MGCKKNVKSTYRITLLLEVEFPRVKICLAEQSGAELAFPNRPIDTAATLVYSDAFTSQQRTHVDTRHKEAGPQHPRVSPSG
jgi:hypothetical protein